MPYRPYSRTRGALGALGEYFANQSQQFGDYFLKQLNAKQANDMALRKWQMEQGPELLKRMGDKPDQADNIATMAHHLGIDLDFAKPSDTELTNPLADKIASATTPLAVPTTNDILRHVQGMGRPSMMTPSGSGVLGPQAPQLSTGPSEPAPSLPITNPDTGEMQASLPSMQTGPSQNPTIQTLLDQASSRKQAIGEQLGLDMQNDFAKTQGNAYSKGIGEGMAADVNGPGELARDVRKQTTLGPINAKNAGLTKGAEARAVLAPDIVTGEANKAGAVKKADLNAEFNSDVTPKILAFDKQKAQIPIDAAAKRQRSADIEDATTAAIQLSRQVNQLKPLYEKAVNEGDTTSAKLYSDLVKQAAVNAGKASGFKGQFREYEFNAAQGLFPSLMADSVLGHHGDIAKAKWEGLQRLITTGPRVLSSVPIGAPIDDYLKAVENAGQIEDPTVADFKQRLAAQPKPR